MVEAVESREIVLSEEEWFPVDDGTKLYLRRWIPLAEEKNKKLEDRGKRAGSPKTRGILHIVHGMAEYGNRYGISAKRLCEQGIEVWAADLRGHGKTADPRVNDPGKGGLIGHCRDQDSITWILSDIKRINNYIREVHPDLPLFILGHSWGSFLVQAYIQEHGQDLAGCILSGSRGPGSFKIQLAIPFLQAIAGMRGIRNGSSLSFHLVNGSYQNIFKPKRTKFDWLSRDEKMVDEFVRDPLCGNLSSSGFYRDMLEMLFRIHKPQALARIPKDLPIYVFSGNMDPVGEMGTSPTRLVEALKLQNVEDLEFVLYPGARHETLNETNREEVIGDLIAWIDKHSASKGKSLVSKGGPR